MKSFIINILSILININSNYQAKSHLIRSHQPLLFLILIHSGINSNGKNKLLSTKYLIFNWATFNKIQITLRINKIVQKNHIVLI